MKTIFEMYVAGSTVTEIINHLNSLGLRTLHGTPFTKNSLHTILKNEKYIGIYEYKGEKTPDAIPRIIDDDTFLKVQEMLKINKRAPAHKWSRADYLLTDKLFCGKCGANMAGESGTSRTGAKHTYSDRVCQKQLISTFVNSVFLYDDHIDVNYNYSGGNVTLSLSDMPDEETEN